jgi:hypothetical protein
VRFVMDPHISCGGVASGAGVKFHSATGAVVEDEYLLSCTGWAQFGFKTALRDRTLSTGVRRAFV